MADSKALKRYEAGVERALGLFDASNEWADYIAFLSRLLKALQASPAGAEIPSKTILAKYLAQCLRPSLPSGVHQKALEAYGLIFSTIGTQGLTLDLPLYFPGFAHTLSFASLSTRPWFLALFDEHILNLPAESLRSALKAILLSLLPGIEEENSEDFKKTLATIDRVREIFVEDDVEDVFWQSMFLASVTSSNRRMGVLIYLTKYLPPLGPTPPAENNPTTGTAKPVPISTVTTPEPGLLIRCFATGLKDEQPLVQRGFLDLLVTLFPLNSSIIQETASPRDIDILFSAALGIVLKRDMGLNRRLWAWLFGNDEKTSYSEEAQRVAAQKPNTGTILNEQNSTGLVSSSEYFLNFGQRHVIQVFYNMIAKQAETPSSRAKPFRIMVSLMDRSAIGAPVVSRIFPDLLTDLMMYQKGAPSQDAFDEVFRSASVLFDSIDPQMIARHLLDLFRNRKLDLLDFVLLNFALDDEEMLQTHLPLIVSVMSHELAKASSHSASAVGDALAKDAEMMASGMGSLLQLLPSQHVGEGESGQTEKRQDDLPKQIYRLYDTASTTRIEVPAALVAEADYFSLHNVIHTILNSLEHNYLSPVQDLLILAFDKLYSRIGTTGSQDYIRTLLDGIAKWSARSHDLTAPTLSTLRNITSIVVSLIHHASNPSLGLQQLIVNTVQDLVTKLWANLTPATPHLHVESVDMIWTLHALVLDELVIDSTILSLLNEGLESRKSDDSLIRFSTFWVLSAPLRSSMSSESNGTLQESQHAGIELMSRTIVLIIDAAGRDSSPNPCREWLAGLPSLKFHFNVVLRPLSKSNPQKTEIAATLWRLQTLVSISKSSSVLLKEFSSSGTCQQVTSMLMEQVQQNPTEQLTLTALAIIRAVHEDLDRVGDPALLELIAQQLVKITNQPSLQTAVLDTLQSLIPLGRNQHPPISLLSILSDGITSPANDSHIDKWITVLCNLLPQYPDVVFFSNLLRLTDCFCSRIQEYFDTLKSIYQPGSSDLPSKTVTTENPERSITNLLVGLEYFLARAHSQVIDAARPTSGQDLNAAEIPQSRAVANNRLTVVLCMQDAIKICGAIWCWRLSKAGGGDTKSFNYLSSKLRVRTRRMLEHLTNAEPQECLETLISLWVQAVKLDTQPRTVMSLLQTLEAARPKFMMPAVFNAVYNRTNPHALDQSQKSTMSVNLSSLELLAFLIEYVESLEDDLLEEIWSDCTSFIREILTNPMPHRQLLLRLIDFASILCQKMENTTFGEQARMRRELSDLSTRLFTAVFAIKPTGFDSTAESGPKDQSIQHKGLALRRFDAGEGVQIFCEALPMMAPILSEGDRLVAVFSGISTNIIMPLIKAKPFPRGFTHEVIRLLLIMSKTPAAAKIWKKDLLEAFNHPSFFDNVSLSDEDGWLSVLKQLVAAEKGLMSELLARLTAPTTAGIVFGVGAATARAEADKQTRLNLRRIALVLLAANVDTFASSLSQTIARLDELLLATPSTSPSSATRGDVYLLVRAICLSFTQVNLVAIWPSVNSELRALFEDLSKTEDAKLSTASHLQGAKLLDLLLLLKLEEFQLQEWLFITDTIDAIYPPANTGRIAAADSLQLDNTQPVELSSGIEGGLRKPLLSTDASRRPSEQRRLLGSFFSNLSIRAFEDTYGLEAVDVQACKTDILLDLFSEGVNAA